MQITRVIVVAATTALSGCQCGPSTVPTPDDKTAVTIEVGPKNPLDSTEPAGVSGLPLLQLRLGVMNDTPEMLTSLTVALQGDVDVVEAASLYLDTNEDGAAGSEDTKLKEVAGPFSDGKLAFADLSAELAPGNTAILVTGTVKRDATPARSVVTSLTSGEAVFITANGVKAAARITTGSAIAGGRKTIGTLATALVAPGSQTPKASTIAPNSTSVAMLQLELSMPSQSVEGARITGITLGASGTANDKSVIQRVRLYRDVNANGVVDGAQDLLLGAVDGVSSDDGTAEFLGLNEAVPPGILASMLAVVDLTGTGATGQTLALGVRPNGVVAVGLRSGMPVATAGTPIVGASKTLDSGGGLFVSAGLMNPSFSSEAVGATGVPMLQLALKAAATQAARVTQLTLRASGFGDDPTAFASVKLYLDQNADGQVGMTDMQLGTSTVTGNDGTATFSGLSTVIAAGMTQTLLVVADFTTTVLPTESYALSFPANENLTAVDPATAAPLLVSGAPLFGGLKTISSQGSLAIAIGVNAPGTSNESASAVGVPVLQFSFAASSVESVRVSSITLRANGSVDDATAISAVHLYRDVNENGQVDAPEDTALGVTQTYAADNGTVIFNGLSEVIAASARTSFVATYDLAGTAAPGQTFGASIAQSTAVIARGVSSAASIGPTGTAGGALKTVQALGSLTIAAGLNTSGTSQQTPGATGVNLLQFSLTASSVEPILVSAMTVRASGTGNDATGVAQVALYRDNDGDGLLDSSDTALGSPLQFSADNGTAVFAALNELIPAGQRFHYLVIESLSLAVQPGQTFNVALTTGMAVAATGTSSMAPIGPAGSAAGAGITIQGAGLTLAADSQNPIASTEFSNALRLPMLQVRATATPSEAVRITRVVATAGGSANDVADVTAVRLYRDADSSGTFTSGDVQLGAPATFSLDNGTVQFTGLTEQVAAGTSISLLLVYDLASTALAGQTFDLRLVNNAAVTAEGVTSSAPAVVTGAPVQGGTKTMRGATLTLATGLSNPSASLELPTATDVALLQLRLSASAGDGVRVTGLIFNAAGSLDDATGISGVRLYRDVDTNGRVGAGDVAIAGPATYSLDNSTVSFSGLSEVIAAGSTVHWVVQYALSGSGIAGQTFDVRIVSNVAVSAESQTTGQAATVTGAPIQSAAKTLRSSSVSLALGASSPSSSSEAPNATGVPMLQVRLTGDASDAVQLNGVTVTAAGSINDLTDVGEVRLYLDNDADGVVDPTDVQLGAPRTFSANDGTAFFSGLTQSVAAGAVVHLLVVYDLSGTAAAGGTFEARFANAAAIQAVSQSSGQSVVATGAPVIGSSKTVATLFNAWTATTRTGAPTPRSNHTAVTDGTRMLVFGGEDYAGQLGDGASYNPATNVWTALPSTGAPSARSFHVAAVAGGHMVVFGGRQGSTYLGDGARFNLSTNTWQPMSATNAPSARAGATVVSAGSTVIVWGGFSGSASVNTGATYDPVADTWAPLPIQAATPSGRYLHSAVWTGSQLIVWGGFNGAYLADGARYQPSTSTWSAVSSAAAAGLVNVAMHSMVWTGSELMVWGGFRGIGYVNNGAAYNPTGDTWRTLAVSGAPAVRGQQSVVFTGARMVIWGGYNGTASLDTGGQLDPVFNTWTPTAQSGAPVSRFGHTAVWVGSRMVVWGGQNATSYLDSGGRYSP